MESVEREYKKKIEYKNQFNMDVLKELQDFYQNCFSQFINELAPVNYGLKKVANRISNGMEMLFQSFLRHHCVEIQDYQRKIDGLKVSNRNQLY